MTETNNQLEEIDLSEFFRIIKKRKKIIISLFFIGLIMGAVWFFLVYSKYMGTIIIEIGRSNGGVFEQPIQVINRINAIFSQSNVNVFAKNSLDTVLIEFRISGRKYDDVASALNKIQEDIIDSHLVLYEKEVNHLDEKHELLEKEKENLEKDIPYFMLRGQQVASLKLEIYNIQNSLDDIEFKKHKIEETKIIVGPKIEEEKPSYLIIVFISLLGLFLGVVFAFLKDWWIKNKVKI